MISSFGYLQHTVIILTSRWENHLVNQVHACHVILAIIVKVSGHEHYSATLIRCWVLYVEGHMTRVNGLETYSSGIACTIRGNATDAHYLTAK